MSTPLLHVLAGPNGSGKSTFANEHLVPATGLPFVNADEIAAERWPGDEEAHAYDASRAAAEARRRAFADRRSFVTETVFSHRSKVSLVAGAVASGYRVELHVMVVPEEVAVARVAFRVAGGGHTVPVDKIRARYRRLWPLVAEAQSLAHRTTFYDNSTRAEFREIAVYEYGQPAGAPRWPRWAPEGVTERGGA